MPPTPEEVRTELESILASPAFAGSLRLSRFLRFVVERTLAGEGERLKEYVLGVEVFDRGADYDPRIDSIVRVEAGRVRSKLEEYYGGEGTGAAIRIRMQKGGYAPLFEHRGANGSAAANGGAVPNGHGVEPSAFGGAPNGVVGARPSPEQRPGLSRPRLAVALVAAALAVAAVAGWRLASGPPPPRVAIAVLPFSADSADEALALRLTERVTAELVRRREIAVIASTSARVVAEARTPLREVSRALDAQFLLQARVHRDDGRLFVEARLVNGSREEKFWVDNFAGTEEEIDDLAGRVATAAAVAVAASVARANPTVPP